MYDWLIDTLCQLHNRNANSEIFFILVENKARRFFGNRKIPLFSTGVPSS